MSRRHSGFAKWVFLPDLRPDLPLAVFGIECCSCNEWSGTSDEGELPGHDWALRHTDVHPDHREFVVTARTHWCVEPADGNPYQVVTQ